MKFILVTSLISMVYVFAMDVYQKVSTRLVYNQSSLSYYVVNVSGGVNVPGTYYVLPGATYGDVVELAGGVSSEGSVIGIDLNKEIVSGCDIVVPYLSEIVKVNINTATADELDSLPNIGAVLANRIISYRSLNGNFCSIEDIKNVTGIGSSLYSKIEAYICID